MAPIEFTEQNVVFAKDQPEYLPLPAHRTEDGRVFSCWKMTLLERVIVLFTGRIWFGTMPFGQPLQPQKIQVRSPFK